MGIDFLNVVMYFCNVEYVGRRDRTKGHAGAMAPPMVDFLKSSS